MNKFDVACLSVTASVMAVCPVNAATLSGPIVNPANGHEYYLLDSDSWLNSEAEAVALGGHLVTLNDADENQWVFDTFGGFGGASRNLWIGLNDASVEGAFEWVSGETPVYSNWAPGEPNNLNGTEDYVHLWSSSFAPAGQWNDAEESGSSLPLVNGVVEVVPEPSTLALVFLGGAVLAQRRREASCQHDEHDSRKYGA